MYLTPGMVDTAVIHLTCDVVASDNVNLTSGTAGIDRTLIFVRDITCICELNDTTYSKKVKVSHNRPRWPKRFLVG